jgi:hypothetical protein
MCDEKEIITALRTGRFFLSVHAARRMRQRSITKADIQACGRTAESCIFQARCGTYRVDGKDIDGGPLTVICGIDEAAIIVTLF